MNKAKLAELKNKYSHIYSVSDHEGTEYLFRSLNISEVKLIESYISQSILSNYEIENLCLEKCLLWPEDIDLDDISPGVASQVANEILRVSGIVDVDFIIESMHNARAQGEGDIISDIKSYIISAMPNYTDDDLNKFTLLELIEKLILSEKILTLQGNLAGIDNQVKLAFERHDAEPSGQERERQQAPVKKKSSGDLPDKEELIRRIRSENINQYSTRDEYVNPHAADEWQGFDLDLLQKMEGETDPNDPIARKLFGLE